MNELKVTGEMNELLRRTVHSDIQIAMAAKRDLAIALSLPLKKGVMPGDNIAGIFSSERFEPGISPEFPLDFLSPGTERFFVAYTVPNTGKLPERHIEGDYIMVPTFDVGSRIDWSRKFARDARWDIVGRAMKVLDSMFVRKKNDDGYHTIITAAKNRGIAVVDGNATSGFFSKRVVSLAAVVMRRNAGGNSTSVDRGKLTHIAMSPEGLEDIRSWDLTQVDEVTRREIFLNDNESMPLSKIFGVTLMDVDEFGESQSYQNYYVNTLSGSMTLGGYTKSEICIGLDLMNKDSFVSPWRVQPNGQEIELIPDVTLLIQNREGYAARREYGIGLLDSRRVLLMAF